jgi:hypothetical protein
MHWGARSRGYKLSREGADPKSLVSGGGDVLLWLDRLIVDLLIARSPDHLIDLDMAPASRFIASKGRARVTFVVKG